MGKLDGRTLVETVTLPSRGLFYGDMLPDGQVKIAALTTREEKIFAGGGSDADARMDMIFDGCMELPEELPPSDLLQADRFFLLFQIRKLSYGDRYGFQFKCENCGMQQRVEMSLTKELECSMAGADAVEPFEVVLPHKGDTLHMRHMRGKDEQTLNKFIRKQVQRTMEPGDPGFYKRLALMIDGINGERHEEPHVMAYVSKLEGPDSMAIRVALDTHGVGYNTNLDLECRNPQCGHINMDVRLPYTAEFFRPRV